MLLALVMACTVLDGAESLVAVTEPQQIADPVVAELQANPLRYTRHARCRMACREVSEAEVRQVLDEGRLDPGRSRSDGECPSHAIESTTDDGQRLRVVYAACPGETRVITAIDLGNDWPCGDC